MPRVLCTRIDALTIRYRGDLNADVRSLIEARLNEAKALGTPVSVRIGATDFELNARSRPGRWVLRNEDASIVIDDGSHLQGWSLAIDTRAMFLATRGPSAAVAMCRDLAASILSVVGGERLGRGDLCADVAGFDLMEIDSGAWLTPRRAQVTGRAVLADHCRADKRTGFTIGKNDVQMRIYDKRQELQDKRDDRKRAVEEELWREAGCIDGECVTRVEVQLRGDVLDELDGGLRDPDTFIARADVVWRYATQSWVRLVHLGTATRRSRCRTDDRWAVVQSAVFNDRTHDVPARTRRRSCAKASVAFAHVLSLSAGAGSVTPIPLHAPNARQHVDRWSEERCEASVRERVALVLRVAEPLIIEHLLGKLGARHAAAFLIERVNAACARASCYRAAESVAGRPGVAA